MSITYLVREVQTDGTISLVETTSEKWHAIIKADAEAPASERRYFIRDVIPENEGIDCIIMETTFEDWRQWDNEQRKFRDNNNLRKSFDHVSIDALLDAEGMQNYQNRVLRDDGFEETTLSQVIVDEFYIALRNWREWAPDLLKYYLAGEKKSCTKVFAHACGVSEQVARKYKRQFEQFIKNYFEQVFRFESSVS